MYNEPRNWKWMAPAALAVALVVMWMQVQEIGEWGLVLLGLAGICVLAAVINLWLYVAEHWANAIAVARQAMYSTPEVRIAEAMMRMHPDAVAALTMRQRVIWRSRYIPQRDLVDSILDEAPTVHVGFVEFVLDHSGAALMPKRMLSQGSKQFDPSGQATDYQQYDDLIHLLEQKLMVSKAMGNQPPVWMPPWTLERVRHIFGLDDDGSVEVEQATPTVKRMEGREVVDAGRKTKEPAVAELTEDELTAIRSENERYEREMKIA